MIVNIWPTSSVEEVKASFVARIAHGANHAYCQAQGQYEIPRWEESSDEIKASAIKGVLDISKGKILSPEDSHRAWMAFKIKAGWTFCDGIRDYAAKTHPCLKPYEALTPREKLKDSLFFNIVRTFVDELG